MPVEADVAFNSSYRREVEVAAFLERCAGGRSAGCGTGVAGEAGSECRLEGEALARVTGAETEGGSEHLATDIERRDGAGAGLDTDVCDQIEVATNAVAELGSASCDSGSTAHAGDMVGGQVERAVVEVEVDVIVRLSGRACSKLP